MLVADEFRTEQNGKVLAIGLYSDGVIVLTIPKNAPKATKERPYGIDGVALLITVGGFVGDAIVKFGVEGGRVLEHPVSLVAGNSANIILNLKPFRFVTFGLKNVFVEFANTKHIVQFEVRANFIDPVQDMDSYIEVAPGPLKLAEPTTTKAKAVAKRAPAKRQAK